MSAIILDGVSKTYRGYRHGIDRLIEILTKRPRHAEFTALQPLNLQIAKGEVLGVVGMNGAGKSTLLKILAGTLEPSTGTMRRDGRVAALLELGAGFHPEMTGRENVYLYGALLGLQRSKLESLYPEIVKFSGLEKFMDEPVKNYSSGMYVRLAFTIATSIDPDVLIVDEALSVGDGAFARASFDRIMNFKNAGKTIIFCSHALYQVEAICTRAVWLHQGKLQLEGQPADVVAAYSTFLASDQETRDSEGEGGGRAQPASKAEIPQGYARITSIDVAAGAQQSQRRVIVESKRSSVNVRVRFVSDPKLPPPTVAVAIATEDGRPVCSAISREDGFEIRRTENGEGSAAIIFPRLPLLKGKYVIQAYLACENSVHLYDQVLHAADVIVTQTGLEQGIVSLPHAWSA